MSDFQPTAAQHEIVGILVDLIGLSGVHKRPEQGDSIVLDLLPGVDIMGAGPFCVRVGPEGSIERISDDEAGLVARPTPMEALWQRAVEMRDSVADLGSNSQEAAK